MSVQALAHVVRSSRARTPAEYAVHLMLAWHAHGDGRGSRPSHPLLAREARCSRSTAQLALDALEARNEIGRLGVTARGVIVWDLLVVAETAAREEAARLQLELFEPVATGPMVGRGVPDDRAATGPIIGHEVSVKGSGKRPSPSPDPFPMGGEGGVSPDGVEAGGKRRRPRRRARRPRRGGAVAGLPVACPLDDQDPGALAQLQLVWTPVAERLRASVGDSVWHGWLEPLHPHRVDADRLVVGASENAVAWIKDRYGRPGGLLSSCAERHVLVESCERTAA